ncbi:hypothetical protein B0A50_04581 [Salinomyces thailandicus]|uniref:Uncharacterized protein n=1 Tax=Salinomyces thailandicus TaxID=706561 RepID=A0A4U0TW54_9PEZI|nr:hypothetical protein B0A50_04581 [Salinomyces thailandica]
MSPGDEEDFAMAKRQRATVDDGVQGRSEKRLTQVSAGPAIERRTTRSSKGNMTTTARNAVLEITDLVQRVFLLVSPTHLLGHQRILLAKKLHTFSGFSLRMLQNHLEKKYQRKAFYEETSIWLHDMVMPSEEKWR